MPILTRSQARAQDASVEAKPKASKRGENKVKATAPSKPATVIVAQTPIGTPVAAKMKGTTSKLDRAGPSSKTGTASNLLGSAATSSKHVIGGSSNNLLRGAAPSSKGAVGGSLTNLIGSAITSSKPIGTVGTPSNLNREGLGGWPRPKVPDSSAKAAAPTKTNKKKLPNAVTTNLPSSNIPPPVVDRQPAPIASASDVPVTTKPASAARTTSKKREGNNLKKFLTKLEDDCLGDAENSLSKQMADMAEKNNREMEALLASVLKDDDGDVDVFMNSPMMVKAVKSVRNPVRVKGPRFKIGTPRGLFKKTPLRILTLKHGSGATEGDGRVTRSKVKVPNLKRMRSPETDSDSPMRLKQTVSKFNFITAVKKQPKKKLKERAPSVFEVESTAPASVNAAVEFEDKSNLKERENPKVIAKEDSKLSGRGNSNTSGGSGGKGKHIKQVNPALSVVAGNSEIEMQPPLPTALGPLDATFVVDVVIEQPIPVAEPTVEPVVQRHEASASVETMSKLNNGAQETAGNSKLGQTMVKSNSGEGQGGVMKSLVQDLSVMILDDDDENEILMLDATMPTDTELMPPPTPKHGANNMGHMDKENKETYEITILADYDEDALEHRADKVIPEWAQDQDQIDYLLYRFSSQFLDEITEQRIFPRGTHYARFYPGGAPKYRPASTKVTKK